MSDNEKEMNTESAAEVVAKAPAAKAKPDAPVVEAEAKADAPIAEAEADKPEGDEMPPEDEVSKAYAEKDKAESAKRGRRRKSIDEVEVGFETQGKVVGLAKFGAFVDIGATTDGLVHISEFPGKRVQKVEDAVSSGDVVDVWVKEVDSSKNRISLSMKKQPDNRMTDLMAGQVLSGTVSSVAKYGAFVDIGAETEGLVHVSEMSSGFVQQPEDIVKVGATIEVRIKEIDRERERISLSMVGLANDVGQGKEDSDDRGGRGGRRRKKEAEEDYTMPDEPEVRMPTALELALRGAGLLDSVEEEEEAPAAVEAPAVKADAKAKARAKAAPSKDGLGDVYSRMLDEYRETKSEED